MLNERRPRILAVDDEPGILFALEDELGEDFEVTTVGRPEEALRLAKCDDGFSLVISDQRMPTMTGDRLFSELRDYSSAVRILCSGQADIQSLVRAVNEGQIFAYITKPWDALGLRARIDEAVELHRVRCELTHSRHLFASLMAHLPRAVFFQDAKQRLLHANAAALRIFGIEDGTAVRGKRLTDLVPAWESARELEERGSELLDHPSLQRLFLQLDAPNQAGVCWPVTITAVRAAGGELNLIGVAAEPGEPEV